MITFNHTVRSFIYLTFCSHFLLWSPQAARAELEASGDSRAYVRESTEKVAVKEILPDDGASENSLRGDELNISQGGSGMDNGRRTSIGFLAEGVLSRSMDADAARKRQAKQKTQGSVAPHAFVPEREAVDGSSLSQAHASGLVDAFLKMEAEARLRKLSGHVFALAQALALAELRAEVRAEFPYQEKLSLDRIATDPSFSESDLRESIRTESTSS